MAEVLAAVRDRWASHAEALDRLLAAERGRFVLWLPIFMGAGDIFYFSLHAEPAWWAGIAVALPAAAAAWLARGPLRVLMLPIAAAGLGFGAAQLATARALPLEPLPRKAVVVTGFVRGVELLPKGRG